MGPREATPKTRPLAPPPVGRWPQTEWRTHNSLRTLVPVCSIKSTPLRIPNGASQGLCRRPAHPALRVFCTPMQHPARKPATLPRQGPNNPGHAPAPFPAMGSPVNSGSSRVAVHNTTHPARGRLLGTTLDHSGGFKEQHDIEHAFASIWNVC